MRPNWLTALKRYLIAVVVLNLLWEIAHMPLYTLWDTGSRSDILFAAFHCTGGDVLIALSSVMLALLLVGHPQWPTQATRSVFYVALTIGFLYTMFSEWLNIEIRQSWAYGDLMPVIPLIKMGLSPALQWVVVPWLAYAWAIGKRLDTEISRRAVK